MKARAALTRRLRQVYSVIILLAVASGAAPAAAQVRRAPAKTGSQTAAAAPTKKAPACSGAWT